MESQEKVNVKFNEPKEQTRVRLNFKVSAKGEFQPDVTSEAETVDTAMVNLDAAYRRLNQWAIENGIRRE